MTPRQYRWALFKRLFTVIAICIALPPRAAAGQLPDCPKPPSIYQFVVDGITGAVHECPLNRPLQLGDSIQVKVVRANPLHYTFTVSTDSVFTLVRGYGVVGEGTRTTPVGGTPIQESLSNNLATLVWSDGALPIPDFTMSTVPTPRELFLARVADRLVELAEALNPLEGLREHTMRGIVVEVRNVVQQDGNLLGGIFPPDGLNYLWPREYECASARFASALPMLTAGLDAVHAEWAKVHKQFTDLRLEIAQYNATGRAKDEEAVSIADFARIYDSVLTRMQGTLEKARLDLDDADKRTARWNVVMKMSTRPELLATFHVVRSNTRVYLKVARRPVSAMARAALAEPPKADQLAPEVVLARLRYESHGQARFGLSVGFAGQGRPGSSTYGTVFRRVNSDSLEAVVAQTVQDRFGIHPVVLFTVYWKGVDDLDPTGPRLRPGFVLGAELSSNASRSYLVGVAVDHVAGFQLAAGASTYQGIRLIEGWSEGDVVPTKTDGSPKTTLIPTETNRRAGWFASVTFRPVIIGSLLKALGLSSAPGAG